jgi:hypothetical protein
LAIDSLFAFLIGTCFGLGAVCAVAGAGYCVVADHLGQTPEITSAIEAEEDIDRFYSPDDSLLSERGRFLRKRGIRLVKIGFAVIGCSITVLGFALTYHKVATGQF